MPEPPRPLRAGDRVLLTGAPPEPRDGIEFQARCSLPQVLGQLGPGSRVTFDDGRVAAEVETAHSAGLLLRATGTRAQGRQAARGPGLNFPGTCWTSRP